MKIFTSIFVIGAILTLQASPLIEQRIVYAKASIQKDKFSPQGYNDLAIALVRRARETADPVFLKQAEEAIAESLRLAPGNFEARRARVMLRLQQHRYADALEEAQALNKGNPDDNLMYGLIADAQIALGNYKEAEDATQRMIDMRQVNAPGLQRGAELRELFGYNDGAQEWWNSSLRLTSAADTEERGWIATHIACLNVATGKPDIADKYLQQALAQEPDYPPALAALAQVRMAQDRAADAVDLLRKRLKQGPDLDSLYQLARALEKAGKADDAKRAYAEFEAKASAAEREPLNANHDLMFYYAEHAGKPKEAVRLGRDELARRHDARTHDALAWALYRDGDFAEARKQMEEALAPGVQDAVFFYHAGAISLKVNDTAAAKKFFKSSLQVDGNSPDSAAVLKALAAIS